MFFSLPQPLFGMSRNAPPKKGQALRDIEKRGVGMFLIFSKSCLFF